MGSISKYLRSAQAYEIALETKNPIYDGIFDGSSRIRLMIGTSAYIKHVLIPKDRKTNGSEFRRHLQTIMKGSAVPITRNIVACR